MSLGQERFEMGFEQLAQLFPWMEVMAQSAELHILLFGGTAEDLDEKVPCCEQLFLLHGRIQS